jgi:glycogen(starch) synthase
MKRNLRGTSAVARCKRVLMTADTLGGVWNYATELSDALGGCGVSVFLATMGAPLSRSQRASALKLANVRVFESSYKLEWMGDPWLDVDRAGQWLLDLEQRIQFDIVHLNGYSHAALPWRAPTIVVAHSCVLSWWEAVKNEEAPSCWNQYRARVRAGLGSADAVIAPTEAMLSCLRKYYFWPGPGLVIPNGRAAGSFTPARKQPFVLCVGRFWDEAKNLGLLEQAAPTLQWPVYAAGDMRHPASGTVSSSSVRLLGNLSSAVLARWLARAAIFASPARYEPFGLAILEAALSACVLVLGDIPSLREVWDDAAYYVSPDDIGAFVRLVNRLTSDRLLREKMGARARLRALAFSRERMLDGYISVYTDLMSAKQAPRTDASSWI